MGLLSKNYQEPSVRRWLLNSAVDRWLGSVHYEISFRSGINIGANLWRFATISRQVQIPEHLSEIVRHDGLSSQELRLQHVGPHKAVAVRLDPYVQKTKPILFALPRSQS